MALCAPHNPERFALAQRHRPFNLAQLDDFLLWAAGGIVLGGRIGYILFYDLGSILENPVRAIQIWNGGMSFHGAFSARPWR